jgi:hypothetical protein
VQGWGFQPQPLAGGGVFEDARVMRIWGLNRDWLERDPNSGERNAPSNEKSGNLSGNFPDPAQKFVSLKKKNPSNLLNQRCYFWFRELILNQRPSGSEPDVGEPS